MVGEERERRRGELVLQHRKWYTPFTTIDLFAGLADLVAWCLEKGEREESRWFGVGGGLVLVWCWWWLGVGAWCLEKREREGEGEEGLFCNRKRYILFATIDLLQVLQIGGFGAAEKRRKSQRFPK